MYRYDIHKMRLDNHIPDIVGELPSCAFASRQELDEIVKGKFKDIIDIIYSDPSSLCSKIDDYGSENSSPAVRSFIQNVLQIDVQSLPSSPDADTAFDTLLPRELYSRDGLDRYSDYIRSLIDNKYKSKVNNNAETNSSE